MGAIYIGISGWRYASWRGVFYPQGLAQSRELEFASRALTTIEINGAFYALQRPASYAAWYRATPPGFCFSVKGHRYLTHMLRLRGVETALANVLASGVFNLREKLGPFLWQLPPNLGFDPERIEHFLSLLPRDSAQALACAHRHAARMAGRTVLEIDANRPLRHALEIRHESFADPAFIDLLRKYNVALVVADSAGKWPGYEDVTADFLYLRLHGEQQLYAGRYSDEALARWARRIRAWSAGAQPADARLIAAAAAPPPAHGRDLFCYFDNDVKAGAPFDALRLAGMLELSGTAPARVLNKG